MEKQFFTMDDFDFAGKVALVRVDINCPFEEKTGKIEDSERIAAHAATIKELSDKKAKVVVLAHQGRKGDPDFIPLQQHASLLYSHIKKPVEYVDDLFGQKALSKIDKISPGEIILLQNTRFYDDETKKVERVEDYSGAAMVQLLSKHADIFVLDGFSVSHRAQASTVGFPELLPSCAGRVMQKELEGLQHALDFAAHPNIYVLGGAKPDDVFQLLKFACTSNSIDKILTSGILGELCIAARGIDLGPLKIQYFKEKGYDKLLPELSDYVSKYPLKIEIPLDFAIEENGQRKEYLVDEISKKAQGKPTCDIGSLTISRYSSIISTSKTLYFKGPVGIYENPLFEKGTREILLAIRDSPAFKLIGGGHSLSAMEKFGIDKSRISHISLAGGAVVEYLQGKKLPGVEALKKAYLRGRNPLL